MCTAHYCLRQLPCLEMAEAPWPPSLSPNKGYPDKKKKKSGADERGGGREVIQRGEEFHFLHCTEKILSAGKTWQRDGRFPFRTLITICSFPDNNRKKRHEPPLKWKRLSFPSFWFCSAEDESLFHRQHAAGVLITQSVIIGGCVCYTGCIAERHNRRGLRSNSPTFVSLGFSLPGQICILMEGFYRLLCGVHGTTSGIIK